MRWPAPMTPIRKVSLAPNTRLEASAVSPLAMRKLRRLITLGRPPVRFVGTDPIRVLCERNPFDERCQQLSFETAFRSSVPEGNGPMTILFQPAPLSHEESVRSANYECKGKLISNNLQALR
jgi:hypothetical protein